MSFGGSVSAMISSMKNNRANLKAGKKKPFDKNDLSSSKDDKWEDHVKLTDEQKQIIFSQIQETAAKEKKKELYRTIFAIFVALLVISVLIIWFLN
jgi:hypothetical protein